MYTIKITRYRGIKLLLFALVLFSAKANAQVLPFGTFHGGQTEAESYRDTITEIVEVTSNTGKVWMDRNLGATRQAQSTTDSEAYGYLYQWGRGNDQHQFRTSKTTSATSSDNSPGHSFFILESNSQDDWRIPQNSDLWQIDSDINNPCPIGFRPPTYREIDNERLSWSSNNASGAYESVLKLTLGGWRDLDGTLQRVGNGAVYWTLDPNGTGETSYFLYVDNTNAFVQYNGYRARGSMIRCICSLNIPTITHGGITNNLINATNAYVYSYLHGDGGAPITERGFVWSTSPNPTAESSKIVVSGTSVRFSGELTGLTPNTTYYWRAYGMNSEGTAYGVVEGVFTTKDQ